MKHVIDHMLRHDEYWLLVWDDEADAITTQKYALNPDGSAVRK